MKEYTIENIRTVALAGHMGSGKTSLAEALLFKCKHTDRLQKVDEGHSTSDYDPEEVRRKISINAAVLPLEYKDTKINLLDLPGNEDFLGEIRNCLRVSEAGCLVLDAGSGVEVGAEYAFHAMEEFAVPCFAFVSKIDKERADFEQVVSQLADKFDKPAVPVALPIGEAESFKGVVDLLKMKALTEDESGKVSSGDIPDDMKNAAESARAALVEAAAEGDDELTMKFLEDEPLTEEEVIRGLRGALTERRFIPVLVGSGTACAGVQSLLDFIVAGVPSPKDVAGFRLLEGEGDEAKEKVVVFDPSGKMLAFVFKTVSDDFAGRLNFFKILRGSVSSDSHLQNLSKDKAERVTHLLSVRGKKQENVHKMEAGDIGCLAKAASIETWDTLGEAGVAERVNPTPMPKPTTLRAISAASKGDEDKLSMSLHRLSEQDPTIQIHRDQETRQTVLGGMGDTHIEVAVARLREATKVEVQLDIPRVAYRETIRKTATGQYRHKKQSGGRGQFGEVHLRVEPNEEGAGFEFGWEVVGGNIPTNYQSAVEKGIAQTMQRGIVAGYPAVDIKAICFDGKYHPVDSSDMAFQIAGSFAFRTVARQADPVILEPVAKVKVTAPEENMGDVMGNFSSKRGRVLGSSNVKDKAIIEAHVPMAEMFEYGREMRSMTGGRGFFEMEFSHYETVPREIQDRLIEEHEKAQSEED